MRGNLATIFEELGYAISSDSYANIKDDEYVVVIEIKSDKSVPSRQPPQSPRKPISISVFCKGYLNPVLVTCPWVPEVKGSTFRFLPFLFRLLTISTASNTLVNSRDVYPAPFPFADPVQDSDLSPDTPAQ